MIVPILKQGEFLIASIQSALSDNDLLALRDVAHMVRLRGAQTLIVGIQPDVAFAMVQLGLTLEDIPTALDLEEGLSFFAAKKR